MTVMKWMSCIVPILEFVGRAQGQAIVQIQVQPQVVGRSIRDSQVTTVFLAPRYVTAIRMPEPINSVVVGDPSSFSAEHSDREPNLVFVKPITPKAAQTNLLISSTRGLQTSLLLVSYWHYQSDELDGQRHHANARRLVLRAWRPPLCAWAGAHLRALGRFSLLDGLRCLARDREIRDSGCME